MNAADAIELGELRKRAGVATATVNRLAEIWQTQLALLEAIVTSPDGTATTDDAVADLAAKFKRGGKWRGAAVLNLAAEGIIETVDVRRSIRPSRHRGLLTLWKAADPRAIGQKIAELRRLLAALKQPGMPVFDPTSGTGPAVVQPDLFEDHRP